jgi:hypothetical protein
MRYVASVEKYWTVSLEYGTMSENGIVIYFEVKSKHFHSGAEEMYRHAPEA